MSRAFADIGLKYSKRKEIAPNTGKVGPDILIIIYILEATKCTQVQKNFTETNNIVSLCIYVIVFMVLYLLYCIVFIVLYYIYCIVFIVLYLWFCICDW